MVKQASWLLVLVNVLALAQQKSDLSEREQANQAIVKRYVDEIYNRHDVSKIDQILARGFRLKTTSQDLDLAGAWKLFEKPQSAFPDWKMEITEIMVDRKTVVIRNRFSGTHEENFLGLAATHKKCAATGTEAFSIDQGKITTVWVTTNQIPLLTCLGLLSAR